MPLPKSRVGDSVKTLQAVAFIGGIGAGILGLPYAVAQVGLPIGIPYIIAVGLLMMGINILVGEIVIGTRKKLQLAGLAKLYFGRTGEAIMSLLMYSLLFSALLIYIVGEGETLRTLFGGTSLNWSIGFFLVASACVLLGMKMIKKIDVFLLLFLTLVITVIIGNGFLHLNLEAVQYTNWKNIFLPYGVLMFAFHASTSIPEAYEVVEKNVNVFRRSIVWAMLFNIVVYVLFAIATVGVMGIETTSIATIGLGQRIGAHIFLFGNVFAAIAMALAFLNVASSLRDSLRWDFGFSHLAGGVVACVLPFLIFMAGLREFITLIDVVGGVIISTELLFLLMIYWKVEHLKRMKNAIVHHATWLVIVLLLAFSIGTVYSVLKFF